MGNSRFALMASLLVLMPILVCAQAPVVQQPLVPPQGVPAAPAPPSQPAVPELRVENVVIGKDEFTRMQREILLLKKRLEEVELRAQIAAKLKDIERINTPQGAPKAQEAPIFFRSMRQSVDGDRTAEFRLSDGAVLIAREGDTLPNGMRVASIRNDSVTLRKGSTTRRLGIGGEAAPLNPAAAFPAGALPLGMPR